MPAPLSNRQADDALGRARARLAAGDLGAARRESTAVLGARDVTRVAAAHRVLAACASKSGDVHAALQHAETALRLTPDDAELHCEFAELAERSGDVDGAIEKLQRAIALRPSLVRAHQQLGIVYGECGDLTQAAQAFAKVVALDPRNARAFNNLGNALRSLGRDADARAAFERAVALRPDYDLAIANVAMMWRDAGEIERAEALLRAALQRRSDKPPLRAIVVMLAGLLRERGALDEARPLYEQAIAMAPNASAREWFNFGRLYAEADDVGPATDAYRKAYALDRKDLRPAIATHLSLPMIYRSAAHLDEARASYGAGVRELQQQVEELVAGLTSDEVVDGLRWTNFFLAYQGADDRELQRAYGNFVRRAVDLGASQWRAEIPSRTGRERLRVGFASAFFHVGTAGRYFRSWITDLPRDAFEVFVYHLYPGLDDIASEIKARADRFVEFGGSRARPSVIAPIIREDALDVLVYPELGMDHTTFGLAALRLARWQIAGWGHPVTTGLSTLDRFLTCGDMEPPGANDHYVETLLELPGIGTHYRRPTIPATVPRTALGLPEDRVLLRCPQSLFKVHPDNDALFARVLATNPAASLVLFDGRYPAVTDRFMRRLSAALEQCDIAARDRVIVLPALPHDDYLRVNQACDVMLDTLHWSGGNTTLDALACALPVVTLPGAFMRGRQSAAMLRLVGADALIAHGEASYLDIASRLINDAAWRGTMAEIIRDGQMLLFERPEPVRAFADALLALR
jgi:CRISPR-associated protein Csy1